MKISLEEKSRQGNTGRVITELGIGNFKAFGEMQRVPVKPLTLIFGANSSGKSSILHALLLAHHGRENDEYDVHQTELAGDMVDLGGFPNYVHKHDPSGEVVLRLETHISGGAAPELLGAAKEREPYQGISRFGLVLHIGFPRSNLPSDGKQRKPLIRMVDILIDGASALRLSPDGPLLQAQPTSHPCLTRALRSAFEWSLSKKGRGSLEANLTARFEDRELTRRRAAELLSMLLADDTAGVTQGTPEAAHMLKDQPCPAISDRTLESQFGRLQEVFSKVLARRPVVLRRLSLIDIGPYADMDRADYRDWFERMEIAEESLTEFFDGHREEGYEEWWPEAQAVGYNLWQLIGFCTERIALALGGLTYLGPLRFVPPRHFTALGIRDPRLVAGGSLAWELLCRDTGIIEAVNKWLGCEHLGTPYRLKARQLLDADRVGEALREGGTAIAGLREAPDLTELVFEDTLANTFVNHRDVGFGVGQVLPILVNAFALKERLILIEQPELHLHPAQQAELGDVFIESALGGRKNTFLLETHSEHLILRIMRRIRETHEGRLPKGATPITPNDVAVLYVDKDGTGRIVREMPLNERGELVKAWPGGFFEEGFRELFA